MNSEQPRKYALLFAALTACASSAPPPHNTAVPAIEQSINWHLIPERIAPECAAAVENSKARFASLKDRPRGLRDVDNLAAIDHLIADVNDALIAHKLLAHTHSDPQVRASSSACQQQLAAYTDLIAAQPHVFRLAQVVLAGAPTSAERMLARKYLDAGRRAGAELTPERQKQVKHLRQKLAQVRGEYMQALRKEPTFIEISASEAASLPGSFVKALKESNARYQVPVDFSTRDVFLANQAAPGARERYYRAFHTRGGRANVARLEQALALRQQLAELLGFRNWAAYRLSTKMARTPERALAMVREVSTRLLPKARAEIVELAALKAESDDVAPFAAWDYRYYKERLLQRRFGVQTDALRPYFPADRVIPAVMALYGQLFGVRFQPVADANVWAPGVQEFHVHDASDTDDGASDPLARFYLDLKPRPGKSMHFSHHVLRPGRKLPDGTYVRPIAAMIGNGPPAEPGRPTLFGHSDVLIFFHEFGHLMHDTLSTAPFASIHGSSVREDFAEAPSQMLENWVWDPTILRTISGHVDSGEPVPAELVRAMHRRKHIGDGAFWTRQAFFAIYDLTIHGTDKDVDTSALWRELGATHTALPPVDDIYPQASFIGFMGGYDAGYYGYIWSKVYAQDMFSLFERDGLDNPGLGQRYRTHILEPGGSAEPDDLLRAFLGRPASLDGFYRDLGIAEVLRL